MHAILVVLNSFQEQCIVHLGIWAFGHLGIWAFGHLGIWAFVHLCICASVHLCICALQTINKIY